MNATSNKEKLQRFIQQHISITNEAADQIAAEFEEIVIPKHDLFLRAGSYANHYMFLCDGFLRAYTLDQEGSPVTTGFYQSPTVVFEVYSFFNRTISTENIEALVDSEGLIITYDKLNHLFHSLPGFRDFGRAMLVRGFVNLKYRMLSMINETAEERYNNLIRNNPDIFQFAPLKDIASYLGITDTSLSRIRKNIVHK